MHLQSHKRIIILASSSPYRKILLEQLKIPFETHSPEVDETAAPGEDPVALVERLAREKAQALSSRYPQAIVIGSDQLATCGGQIAGKPGNKQNAVAQLQSFSGQTVLFHTAISVVCARPHYSFERTVSTKVIFRNLDDEEIHRYVEADNPTDCAGSFKSESLGISLLRGMSSDDPTAIVGLPLIAVSDGLREAGIDLP